MKKHQKVKAVPPLYSGKPDNPEPSILYNDDSILESAFNYFRENGFPYPDMPVHVSKQELNALAATPKDKLLKTTTAYAVADRYHPHRWTAEVDGKKTPLQAWNTDIDLQKALGKQLENGNLGKRAPGFLSIVNGTQACSNFRPGFALHLYRKYCDKNSIILDTSTGYGGRLVGFIASRCKKYIGIDPNIKTYQGNIRMCKDLGVPRSKVQLINLPAEDVDPLIIENQCDFAFTSPPYFSKEHYSEDSTQSWKRYPTGEEWNEGFLKPMMRLQFAALKKGAFTCINIANVKIKKEVFPLEQWTKEAGIEAGFTYEGETTFRLQWRFAPTKEEKGYRAREPLFTFKKL